MQEKIALTNYGIWKELSRELKQHLPLEPHEQMNLIRLLSALDYLIFTYYKEPKKIFESYQQIYAKLTALLDRIAFKEISGLFIDNLHKEQVNLLIANLNSNSDSLTGVTSLLISDFKELAPSVLSRELIRLFDLLKLIENKSILNEVHEKLCHFLAKNRRPTATPLILESAPFSEIIVWFYQNKERKIFELKKLHMLSNKRIALITKMLSYWKGKVEILLLDSVFTALHSYKEDPIQNLLSNFPYINIEMNASETQEISQLLKFLGEKHVKRVYRFFTNLFSYSEPDLINLIKSLPQLTVLHLNGLLSSFDAIEQITQRLILYEQLLSNCAHLQEVTLPLISANFLKKIFNPPENPCSQILRKALSSIPQVTKLHLKIPEVTAIEPKHLKDFLDLLTQYEHLEALCFSSNNFYLFLLDPDPPQRDILKSSLQGCKRLNKLKWHFPPLHRLPEAGWKKFCELISDSGITTLQLDSKDKLDEQRLAELTPLLKKNLPKKLLHSSRGLKNTCSLSFWSQPNASIKGIKDNYCFTYQDRETHKNKQVLLDNLAAELLLEGKEVIQTGISYL